MITVSSTSDLRQAVDNVRVEGHTVGFVPTMGNLHAGHIELVKIAQRKAAFSVVSIFVNPLQFGPDEDFSSYPRTLEADVDKLRAAGTDVLFTPDVGEIYPEGKDATTPIAVSDIAERLCGASRPGHFQGVATVVARLFELVNPDVAVFGEKDFQQLQVIRRLVLDLSVAIEIVAAPTQRELDGLAMSSRNRYLEPSERAVAPLLYQALNDVAGEIITGNTAFRELEQQAVTRLADAGFEPEYFSICRQSDLVEAQTALEPLRVLAAARLGKARLIDNLAVSVD